ncbi:MAG: hypothetical protein DSM107014_11090 [Gomphosphaeria aponina SAG 52.96 = DSM 107014]|uniref:Uncharacterized protein n=1 Tax=Gomphosphaeria aponina SAG 52.96 = DSM 107014 TaxID=1521640 RepID=A0A941GRC8_9CHRO|nr:hypothetical protein [Gomphosphaeria aponina SAG 52.96 = DSM 107014]
METRKILIATKTYPSISTKYKETVCTAGILLDEQENPLEWIRIYPIRFRELDFDKRYPRWSIIKAQIEKNEKDSRPESFKIKDSSLEIIRKIDPSKNWQERKSFVLPLQFNSIQELEHQGKTLGIIKPKSIEKYYHKETEREWKPSQQQVVDQLDLFEEQTNLEKIPYKFIYKFTDENNKTHNYSISDWEIQQLYRKCRDQSKLSGLKAEKEALEKVRQKLEDEFLEKKDLYFIVGNLNKHRNRFIIIGLFYPPLIQLNQMDLFGKL